MKIGSIVVPKANFQNYVPAGFVPSERQWVGIVIDFDEGEPVVFWDEEYREEIEYAHQLEVIGESSN